MYINTSARPVYKEDPTVMCMSCNLYILSMHGDWSCRQVRPAVVFDSLLAHPKVVRRPLGTVVRLISYDPIFLLWGTFESKGTQTDLDKPQNNQGTQFFQTQVSRMRVTRFITTWRWVWILVTLPRAVLITILKYGKVLSHEAVTCTTRLRCHRTNDWTWNFMWATQLVPVNLKRVSRVRLKLIMEDIFFWLLLPFLNPTRSKSHGAMSRVKYLRPLPPYCTTLPPYCTTRFLEATETIFLPRDARLRSVVLHNDEFISFIHLDSSDWFQATKISPSRYSIV